MSLPKSILDYRIVPVARRLDADRVPQLAEALIDWGIPTLEVTLEGGEGLRAIAALAGSGITVGAGTVMTVEEASAAIDAGAEFLVSPDLNPELVAWAAERAICHLPGVFTPTEVASALSLGADTVKVFPANVGGPELISALLGPFPNLLMVPSGGIRADNARSFVDAGAVAVGVGSWLTGPEDPFVIAARTRAVLEALQ